MRVYMMQSVKIDSENKSCRYLAGSFYDVPDEIGNRWTDDGVCVRSTPGNVAIVDGTRPKKQAKKVAKKVSKQDA